MEVKKEVQIKTEEVAEKSDLKADVRYETDCPEAFLDPEVGGLALALPHGSLLVEVAKQELHATTALRNPNKMNPCRVGLVFYQHGSLHLPRHGKAKTEMKNLEREFRDYVSWLKGLSVVGEKRIFYNFPHSRLLCSNHSETQQDEKGGIHLSRR